MVERATNNEVRGRPICFELAGGPGAQTTHSLRELGLMEMNGGKRSKNGYNEEESENECREGQWRERRWTLCWPPRRVLRLLKDARPSVMRSKMRSCGVLRNASQRVSR